MIVSLNKLCEGLVEHCQKEKLTQAVHCFWVQGFCLTRNQARHCVLL